MVRRLQFEDSSMECDSQAMRYLVENDVRNIDCIYVGEQKRTSGRRNETGITKEGGIMRNIYPNDGQTVQEAIWDI